MALAAMLAPTGCSHFRHRTHDRPLTGFDAPHLRCRSEQRVQRYVGRIATDHAARFARFYARADVVKRFGPGEPIVPEHQPGRLVLRLDAEGRIVAAICR